MQVINFSLHLFNVETFAFALYVVLLRILFTLLYYNNGLSQVLYINAATLL